MSNTLVDERKEKGRKEARRSHSGRTRLPDLSHYYNHKRRPTAPGTFHFSLEHIDGKGNRISMTWAAEAFEWSDEEAVLQGSVTLRRPEPLRQGKIKVAAGNRIRCRVRSRNSKTWHKLWTMRAGPPEIALTGGTTTIPLSDDLEALSRNKRHWSFRKTKRHPGYRAHEVARIVAKKAGVKIGHLAKGTIRLPKIVGIMTDLEAIRKAYKAERDKTGRRFVIRIRNGKLEIVPYGRNKFLYELGNRVEDALLTQEGSAHPTTRIEAKGRLGKGKDSKKVKYTAQSRAAIRRFGLVTEEKDYGRVDSMKDLREKADRDLAKAVRPKRTGTLTFPGIPWLHRGEGMRWKNREPGWHGPQKDFAKDRSYVFIKAIRHRVEGGVYTTDADIVQDDPFVKDKKRRDKEARERAKKRKEKKKGG